MATTDPGAHIETQLLGGTLRTLGFHRSRTTAYHLGANGMVERLHGQLKAPLAASDSANWIQAVPAVILGLGAAFKHGIGGSTAEFVYRRTYRLLGEYFAVGRLNDDDAVLYSQKLASRMLRL